MSKFIKIKNDTGSGEMVLRTRFILKVIDREGDGGASIVYGEDVRESSLFKTASTAAEVLAAIEGKKEPRGLKFFSRAEYEQQYGAGAGNSITVDWRQGSPMGERIHPSAFSYWHHIDKQEYLNFNAKSAEELPDGTVVFQGLERMINPDSVLSQEDLALFLLKNELETELENQTGFGWDVAIHEREKDTTYFRCVPAESSQHFDAAALHCERLKDESRQEVADRAKAMRISILASWRLRGL